jgi:hypothetical protein
MYFDGQLSSLAPTLHNASAEIDKLRSELDSLHQAFDRLGAHRWGTNGEMSLGERFESLLAEPDWTKIK